MQPSTHPIRDALSCDESPMSVRTLARYATVAAIFGVVGGIFVYREYLAADEGAVLGVIGAVAERPAIGEPVPDFILAGTDGDVRRLSDFRGHTVVLNFWATWCVPCRTEMPHLEDAALADTELVVLGVNAQETPPVVERFVEDFALTFPIVLDRAGDVRTAYGVLGLPATFFIDADGILRARTYGPVYGDLLSDGIAAARPGP